MNEPEQIKDQKLLPPAILTEEDEFYASFNTRGINLVDRVNGKPVYVYPYWIDRPNCNWHSPHKPEEDEDYFSWYEEEDEGEDGEDEGDEGDEVRVRANGTGLIDVLKRWWHRHKQPT